MPVRDSSPSYYTWEKHMPAFRPRKGPPALLTPLWRPCLGFVWLAVALLAVGPARAGDDDTSDLETVLALEPDEVGLSTSPDISPETIVQVCSTALEKKDSYPTEVVAKLFILRACANGDLHKYEKAKEDASEALKLSPDSVSAARMHAGSLYHLGAAKDAFAEMEALAKQNPRSAAVQVGLGAMFYAEGKVDDCITACTKAIDLDAQFAPAYLGRAAARLGKKDYSGGVEDMKRFIDLRPLWGRTDQETPYLILGEAYLRLGQPERALRAYEMAVRLNPDSFEARYGVWSSYFDSGRYAISYALARQLIRLDEKEFRGYMAAANSGNMTGHHRKAIEAANQALALEPKLADAHDQLSMAYYCLSQYGSAIKECERALAIDPGHVPALTRRALLLAACPEEKYRDGPKARELATKACKATDYKDPQPLAALAAADAECGDFKEAVRLQKQALSLMDTGASSDKEEFERGLGLYEKGQPFRLEFESAPVDDK